MEATCSCGCGDNPRPGKRFVQGHWSRTEEAKALFRARRKQPAANPSGLCGCGCGEVTPISDSNHAERGYLAGEHIRFVPGHQLKKKRGANANAWRGGTMRHRGYLYEFSPDHPFATKDGYVMQHRLVVEATLGRYLTRLEHVHHINGVKDDNRPDNLIALPHAEHTAMHSTQALRKFETREPERARRAHVENGQKGAAARWGTKPG